MLADDDDDAEVAVGGAPQGVRVEGELLEGDVVSYWRSLPEVLLEEEGAYLEDDVEVERHAAVDYAGGADPHEDVPTY